MGVLHWELLNGIFKLVFLIWDFNEGNLYGYVSWKF